jgi:hypothetical protein
MVLASLVLVAACSDTPSAPPAAVADQQSLQTQLVYDGNGAEYEFDTGNAACPAILNSNVKHWVPINAVGQRLFTFFAPHVRIGYLGNGVYRYRMTIGLSDDSEWMAEGSWTGKCIGYAQWGIGKVITFEGTVWRTGEDDSGGCWGGGGGGYRFEDPIIMSSYDPYAAAAAGDEEVAIECGGGGGDGGGGSSSCTSEWMEIEVSYDGGISWSTWWSGWGLICHNNEV